MKQITDKEYKEYLRYKSAILQGRILTPQTLRIICHAHDNNPEEIGVYLLGVLRHFERENYPNDKTYTN